jgi:glycine/D-amino acid oxidase-like deaminating enzyme
VIGPHPDENDLFVFNGLGTKGVSLAPWCAARLADYVTGAGSLPDELNISRFYPLYFKYLQDSQ